MSPTHVIPDLTDGWSYPITPAEVEEYFPNVGHVSWRTGSKQEGPFGTHDEVVILLSWHPRISRPQPILTVRAVRTCRRVEVRTWIDDVVISEARAWLESLSSRSDSWRERAHTLRWTWRLEMDPPH